MRLHALVLVLWLCSPAAACLNDSRVAPTEDYLVRSYNADGSPSALARPLIATAGLVGVLLLYQNRRKWK